MSDLIKINEKHGQTMYSLGIKHAISMFELAGENALPKLYQNMYEAEAKAAEITKELEGSDGNASTENL